jgi:hypothetical protein
MPPKTAIAPQAADRGEGIACDLPRLGYGGGGPDPRPTPERSLNKQNPEPREGPREAALKTSFTARTLRRP